MLRQDRALARILKVVKDGMDEQLENDRRENEEIRKRVI